MQMIREIIYTKNTSENTKIYRRWRRKKEEAVANGNKKKNLTWRY